MQGGTTGNAWDKSEHLYFNVPNKKPLPMQWFFMLLTDFQQGAAPNWA